MTNGANVSDKRTEKSVAPDMRDSRRSSESEAVLRVQLRTDIVRTIVDVPSKDRHSAASVSSLRHSRNNARCLSDLHTCS